MLVSRSASLVNAKPVCIRTLIRTKADDFNGGPLSAEPVTRGRKLAALAAGQCHECGTVPKSVVTRSDTPAELWARGSWLLAAFAVAARLNARNNVRSPGVGVSPGGEAAKCRTIGEEKKGDESLTWIAESAVNAEWA